MSTVPFDTLKLADRLAAGGFTEEQAKTAASALSEAFKDDIATKTDIANLKSDIGHLETSINQKLEPLESRITVKFGGMIVVAIGAIGGPMKLIHG